MRQREKDVQFSEKRDREKQREGRCRERMKYKEDQKQTRRLMKSSG